MTPADKARSPYLEVPFEVPAGTTRIDVAVDYPKSESCIVDLGCADPRFGAFPAREGFRGWSGGARSRFSLGRDGATPGYVAGEIPAGTWSLLLGLYRIPPEGAEIRIDVSLDSGERALSCPAERPAPRRAGAGWYRGDFHCHTFHSDAAGSPETLHAAARQAGLDFLAVTDHNTVTARQYFDGASSPALVFLRGMEVTTEHGHANVFGLDDWIDFRITAPGDAHVVAAEVHAKGGLLSINHDKPDFPWRHDWPETDLMEVWQHPWLAWNWVSLERWQARLAAGMRLPAIGGSDWHQPAELRPEGPFTLARPTTVLHLPELSEAAVLTAMKAGHGYITEAPDGPHLELTLGDTPMGGTGHGEAALTVRGAAGDIVTFHDATGEIARAEIAGEEAVLRPDLAPRGFLRAELVARASRERLLEEFRAAFPGGLPWGLTEEEIARQPLRRALTNPIWTEDLR
ncbi:putative secreted protein [Oceanicola granulosus HTCC2516]|uniref:Putative secreted protein n=1 Tax=Oceanicola granulosus (strain ATCC BAA-861 / DSM 15982 / KCTC 12143 / HTCC2516) TaxID=314256 RepID=Q2CEN3_OCEGH|nr:putative secreted protein [Oceanicola granulosus HTCC2516]